APEVPLAENPATTVVVPELNLEKEAAAMGPPLNKRRRKRDKGEAEANAPSKPQPLLEQDIAQRSGLLEVHLVHLHRRPTRRDISAWVGCDQQLSPGYPRGLPRHGDHIVPPGYFLVLRHLPNDDFLGQYNVNLARQVAMGSQLRLRFEQHAKLLKKTVARVARRDQIIQAREVEIKNLEALLEAEADMKKAAEAKNAKLSKELDSLRIQLSNLQVSNKQLTYQVSTLQGQVTREEKIKAAFKDFKKYEDDRVTSRCADIDARLDALSIDFDEELYPHMLTAIAGRRWVIRHGLRLAVMKCAESMELRQVFDNVVSAGIAKGMSEGLRHGVEHGKAKLDLAAVEAYDPEADDKFTTALQALKDLYDTGEDAPQFIRDLCPSSSQLKIPVYPEKKKKSRVVCYTHGVGSAHHARSDGVPVSVPTVAPQGLKIMLADAATQTEVSEDEGSPRLLRSKSLPPMFNLDWS
ncbi:hypothetical protein Tco_1163236, partial [Tanacetum coccineum]